MVARLWDIQITGRDHIPGSGPVILVANHLSFIDSVFLMTVTPRTILAVGKAEYMSDWKTRWLFPAAGMLPVDRAGGFAARAAMTACERALADGNIVLIYPEGTRSRDGFLHAGHAGAALLALRTGAPIVPAGVVGTERIQPPGAALPRCFLPCEIHIGDPIEVTRRAERAGRRTQADHITDEIMTAISNLSGQPPALDYPPRTPLVIAP